MFKKIKESIILKIILVQIKIMLNKANNQHTVQYKMC